MPEFPVLARAHGGPWRGEVVAGHATPELSVLARALGGPWLSNNGPVTQEVETGTLLWYNPRLFDHTCGIASPDHQNIATEQSWLQDEPVTQSIAWQSQCLTSSLITVYSPSQDSNDSFFAFFPNGIDAVCDSDSDEVRSSADLAHVPSLFQPIHPVCSEVVVGDLCEGALGGLLGGTAYGDGGEAAQVLSPPLVLPQCPPPGEASLGGFGGCDDRSVGFPDIPCSLVPCGPSGASVCGGGASLFRVPCRVPDGAGGGDPGGSRDRVDGLVSSVSHTPSSQNGHPPNPISNTTAFFKPNPGDQFKPVLSRALNLERLDKSHCLMQKFGVIFCSSCGSWTMGSPIGLCKPCDPSLKDRPSQRNVLKRLAANMSPKKGFEWPLDPLVSRLPGPLFPSSW